MPELPEVETVRLGLAPVLVGNRFASIEQRRGDLRFPLPQHFTQRLEGRRIEALDRRGLLRDVSDVMALERLSIDGVNSDTDPNDRIATIVMRTAVRDSEQLGRVLQRLSAVPNVLRALRLA